MNPSLPYSSDNELPVSTNFIIVEPITQSQTDIQNLAMPAEPPPIWPVVHEPDWDASEMASEGSLESNMDGILYYHSEN